MGQYDAHPKGWANPVTMRASAALPAAGAWDAAPTEQNCFGARGVTLSLTYTRGAAGGAFDFQFEYSIYSVAANVPAGAGEWAEGTLYDPGALAPGVDVQSRVQQEYVTYGSTGAAAATFGYDLVFDGPVERIRIAARESGVPGTPGTLVIAAEFWE